MSGFAHAAERNFRRVPDRDRKTGREMEFHLDANGTDGTRPLLYMWEIHDAQTGELRGRYVGKALRGSRRPETAQSLRA